MRTTRLRCPPSVFVRREHHHKTLSSVAYFCYIFKVPKAVDDQQLDDLLHRGVEEIIDPQSLARKARASRKLRIKFGIDPTGHFVHLGHAVPLRKLRAWQDLGHQVVLIIGDFTARIGDPTGRDEQRTTLSAKLVNEYSRSYLEQISVILDTKRLEVRYNSEWYEKLTPERLLQLIQPHTLQQLLAHETFRRRLDTNQPISLIELLYPILQGYDSVMVEADVEIGGLDQKFNLLTGRSIQTQFNQPPQDIMLTPYLTGLDGKKKMSKTLGNFIAITDPPKEMFGKVMSIPDKLIISYFELVTTIPVEEVAAIKKELRAKKKNPRDSKAKLAAAIVELYHGKVAAEQAGGEFTRTFRHKETPKDIPSVAVKPGEHQLLSLLINHQLAGSRSEARRLIEQGGVRVDKVVVTDWQTTITIKQPTVIQVGKRQFLRLVPGS